MKTREITYGGRTVALADLPEYRKFYGKLSAGTWEPNTFQALAANLDSETVYVDIGAWIGVTPFWASAIAKRVIAVEPDPKCFAIIRELMSAYGNVELINGALSAAPKVALNAVDGFGSSESSVLDIGDGGSVDVPGITMEQIMAKAAGSKAFVKIDIEGYEFAVESELATLRKHDVRGVQLAVHPQLLIKTLRGTNLLRRLAAAWRVWRLARVFKGLFPAPRLAKYRSVLSYIIWGIVFRDEPRGADLLFERAANKMKGLNDQAGQ